jgi:hypothetical protein
LDSIPLEALLSALVLLLVLSAFFSGSETSMMAVNRYRLKTLSKEGHRGAHLAEKLLAQTDKLLSAILIGNNLVNSAAAALVTVIVFRLFGESELALTMATLLVTFLILVFSEVTPKVVRESVCSGTVEAVPAQSGRGLGSQHGGGGIAHRAGRIGFLVAKPASQHSDQLVRVGRSDGG